MQVRRPFIGLAVLAFTASLPGSPCAAGETKADTAGAVAERIVQQSGFSGGVCVVLRPSDAELAVAVAKTGRFVVHVLCSDPAGLETMRRAIQEKGVYGRVSADLLRGDRLPYAENLVNLVLAEDLGGISMDEVMRVLRPLGEAWTKKGSELFSAQKTVLTPFSKPWPEAIDEWTHYLHGADGNPVARDRVVGPPERYQWIAGPLWLRSHESDSSLRTLVTARGRLFAIVDEAPASILGPEGPPDKWFLIARDAFNGVLLWKVPIEDWGWRAWKPSWFTPRPGCIPLNIEKRLVAIGERVYVTLGYRAPVSELDAQTGQVLTTYDGTDRAAEILYHDGRLVLTLLEQDRARVALLDAERGKRLWASENAYAGTTVDYYRFRAMRGSVPAAKVDPTLNTATDGRVIALIDGADVVCLDFATGQEKWRRRFPLVEADYKAGNIDAQQRLWTGTMIVRDGVVLHASPNQLAGFSAASGELLWTQPKKYLGHLWYEWKDVFVIDGLVWTWSAELEREPLDVPAGGRRGSSSWPATVNGYDLHTGELKKEVPLGKIFKTHHHHRCYRNKATTRYILASRRGTEYVDLEEGQHCVHNWVRGTCHVGMMPANGLQYAPPHPCQCYVDEKLNGFNALAPAGEEEGERGRGGEGERGGRLVRGSAYAGVGGQESGVSAAEDWPTFRHDALRSGSVKTEVPATPKLLWQKRAGGKLAAPIVAGGRVFVPLVDEHQVVALRAADGSRLWDYTAGARIDSPPTYHRGTVVFGSADGWVYCLRAEDGELAWRFRAAPEDRLIGAFGQLESAWPVHGSVLVLDGTAYFAAGRCSHLDGGIRLFALDAATGEVRHETTLAGPSYGVDDISQNYGLPMGALADVLQSDGELIHMREAVLSRKLEEAKGAGRGTASRVVARGGLLDDSYFKRMPWSFGPKAAYARLIVHDAEAGYFARMFDSLQGLDPKVYFTPGKEGYLLFAIDRQTGKQTWARRIRVRVNAMVATQGPLFVAGPPDVIDPDDPLGAFEGRKGGVLVACDRADGTALWETNLSAPPVFNGMAAAAGRLYVAMQDGSVACFGE